MTREMYFEQMEMENKTQNIIDAINNKYGERIVNNDIFVCVMEINGENVYFINFELTKTYVNIRGYYKTLSDIENHLDIKITK